MKDLWDRANRYQPLMSRFKELEERDSPTTRLIRIGSKTE